MESAGSKSSTASCRGSEATHSRPWATPTSAIAQGHTAHRDQQKAEWGRWPAGPCWHAAGTAGILLAQSKRQLKRQLGRGVDGPRGHVREVGCGRQQPGQPRTFAAAAGAPEVGLQG